uniref:Uncharacterized protein n=1 Tax=Arundo donax TaxID=35708 RepID=A0A0A8YTD1_ARUDO
MKPSTQLEQNSSLMRSSWHPILLSHTIHSTSYCVK